MRGRLVGKKGGQKIHPSYEVLVRLLPLDECILPEAEKRRIEHRDFALHVEAGPLRRLHLFDAFRSLKTELEGCRVFSLDRRPEVDLILRRNPDDTVVLVDAQFPRTYKRQNLGFTLTERQLNQRAVLLNSWLGSLLQGFHYLPFLAKQLVVRFLSDPDSSDGLGVGGGAYPGLDAEHNSRDEIVLSMLKLTYTPVYKKQSAVEEEDSDRGVEVVDGGCACVIM
mmetsp:Transcript_26824/g.59371  ORF Transcript_26824/g.59371 Transcript_26824/m.59371 type:complete len:224 (-) Transcript_26824:83-754(-)